MQRTMNSHYSTDQYCHTHFHMSDFQLQSKEGIETREEVIGAREVAESVGLWKRDPAS